MELVQHGEMFIAARGGAGGHGNAFYLSNMVRKPLKAEEGGRGEKVWGFKTFFMNFLALLKQGRCFGNFFVFLKTFFAIFLTVNYEFRIFK
jgi:hypothetical protein